MSYDVCALFTNEPLDETIEIIAEKAFKNNWFNETHGLNLTKTGLTELLRIATKDQLFQFDGQLYEQVDGVAMGSPLGPLMANVFLCSIEEQLDRNNKLPSFYKRYVDDTLATMPNIQAATAFLSTLNECHPAIQFTMEIAENNKLPFLGMMIEKSGCHLTTSVYRKPTDTGLLLHYQSHVDQRYKKISAEYNAEPRLPPVINERIFYEGMPTSQADVYQARTRGLRSKAVMKSQLKLTRLHQNLSE